MTDAKSFTIEALEAVLRHAYAEGHKRKSSFFDQFTLVKDRATGDWVYGKILSDGSILVEGPPPLKSEG